MRRQEMAEAWVVYKMTINGKGNGGNAVCEQSEWDRMEQAQPGYHTLVRGNITNEAEAERLARVGTHSETTAVIRLKSR